LAPTALRGRFVSAYQLAITIGIFLAYLVDGWLCLAVHAGSVRRAGLLLFGVALARPRHQVAPASSPCSLWSTSLSALPFRWDR
jgi:hypothetical protein